MSLLIHLRMRTPARSAGVRLGEGANSVYPVARSRMMIKNLLSSYDGRGPQTSRVTCSLGVTGEGVRVGDDWQI